VLGAGLDTYAYRGALREQLRMFEVDHPATQAWKRERLTRADIPVPPALTFAPIDFERQTLEQGLMAAKFDPSLQTFFTWLGCVPYLTEEAVWSTLQFVASLSNGAHVVFDYADPPASLSPEARASHDQPAARVAELGEPWLNYFEADKLRAKLLGFGFREIEDLGPRQIGSCYFPSRAVSAPEKGGHIVHAATIEQAPVERRSCNLRSSRVMGRPHGEADAPPRIQPRPRPHPFGDLAYRRSISNFQSS